MTRLNGKVAVVTGGASGMGRATALRFCAEGASVVVGDLNRDRGKELLKLAADRGYADCLRFVHADVSDENDVADLFDQAVVEFGRLDIAFNNAGVGGAYGALEDVAASDWDFTFAANTRSVFLAIKHASRILVAQGAGGSILNTASVGALSGDSAPVAYSAAKAAVVNLTMSAAVLLAPSRIRVNCICPGAILTPLLVRTPDEHAAGLLLDTVQPWPQHGRPEDIANVALFFASDESSFVTGTSLNVDGGLMAAGPQMNVRLAELMRTPLGASGVSRGSTGEAHTMRRPTDARVARPVERP